MKHSEEIKELAVLKYKEWASKRSIYTFLKISDKTLDKWILKKEKTWKIEDNRNKNGKNKKFSDEALKEFYDKNINATLKDGWKNFWVTHVAIQKRLKKMKYSYKKKNWNIKKEMKKKEKIFWKN